jgi:hypothetical protein
MSIRLKKIFARNLDLIGALLAVQAGMSNPYQAPVATPRPPKQKRSTTATLGVACLFLALYSVWRLSQATPQPDNPSSLPFIAGQLSIPLLFFVVGIVLIALSYRAPRSQPNRAR